MVLGLNTGWTHFGSGLDTFVSFLFVLIPLAEQQFYGVPQLSLCYFKKIQTALQHLQFWLFCVAQKATEHAFLYGVVPPSCCVPSKIACIIPKPHHETRYTANLVALALTFAYNVVVLPFFYCL